MKKNSHFKSWLKIRCSLALCLSLGLVIASIAKADSFEEQNKAAIRRLIDEIYHKENMAVFDEIVADNAVLHDNEKTITQLEMAKRQIRMVLNRYRDIQITIEDMIAEGDKVVTRATFRGIFRQNGKNLVSASITISKFKDGKIIEVWRAFDIANIFRQLEIPPPPRQ